MIITTAQIYAVVASIIPVIVALSAYFYRTLEAKLPLNKQIVLQTVATQAVHMAEQVLGPGSGVAKKSMATASITDSLKSLGVKVDPALVSTALEAVVYSINQQAPHLTIRPVDTSTTNG